MASNKHSGLVSRAEAARFLGVSQSLLEKATLKEPTWDGPPIVRIGRRVLYSTKELSRWAARKTAK